MPEFHIDQRRASHGHFRNQCLLTQALKNTMRCGLNWGNMHPALQEALEMIQLKISRILQGDPTFEDHWVDIAGYAQAALVYVIREEVAAEPNPHPQHHLPLEEAGSFMVGPGNLGLAEFD